MANEEILQKAIEKAKKNGWKTNIISRNPGYENMVLFDHDFARAFFGRTIITSSIPCNYLVRLDDAYAADLKDQSWKIHLMKMVISEDPVKYLAEYINE